MAANAQSIIGYAGVLLLACGDPTGVSGSSCQQTFEFGNFGCAEVVGSVTGLSGQPLPGRPVFVRVVPHGAAYSGGFVRADAEGRFRNRIFRMTQRVPSIVPDTFSVWILSIDLLSAELPDPVDIRDSVLLRLTLSPVGQQPVVATANITLPL